MTVKSYDSKSYDLAEYFLENEPNLNNEKARHDLACAIQTAVEDWFDDRRKNFEPRDPPGWEGGFAENH